MTADENQAIENRKCVNVVSVPKKYFAWAGVEPWPSFSANSLCRIA